MEVKHRLNQKRFPVQSVTHSCIIFFIISVLYNLLSCAAVKVYRAIILYAQLYIVYPFLNLPHRSQFHFFLIYYDRQQHWFHMQNFNLISTDNQILGIFGLEPYEGGNVRRMSLNYVDVDIANTYQLNNAGADEKEVSTNDGYQEV